MRMKRNKQLLFLLLSLPLAVVAGCGNNAGSGAVSTLAASESCIGCHANATSPGTGANIVTEWKASAHNTEAAANKTGLGSGCRDCHLPAPGHPNSCGKCHGGVTPGALPSQDVVINPDQDRICFNCHGLGMDPTKDVMLKFAPQHFGNMTASSKNTGYRASYLPYQNITTGNMIFVGSCRNCHNPHDTSSNISINHKAAAMDGDGHTNYLGSWGAGDFKTRGTPQGAETYVGNNVCVRCHTTTGYLNFVTSGFSDVHPWGVASDKFKEVLYCYACHDDGKGKAYSFKIRKVAPMVAYYNYSSIKVKIVNYPVNYPAIGPSNLCMPCHTGRQGSGQLIKDIEPQLVLKNITSVSKISGGHNYTAGATIFKIAGYEFPGRNYDNPTTYVHDQIGMNNFRGTGTGGPCVGCHMMPNRHSYKAVLQTYTSGQVLKKAIKPSAIFGSTILSIESTACAHCHDGWYKPAWTPAKLQAQKIGFYAATEVLKEMIKVKATPKTGTKYWQRLYTSARSQPSRSNAMGASFNQSQLALDPGAYVHNGVYTKRLIYDSIVWLYYGDLDQGHDLETAINTLSFANSKNLTNVFYNTTTASAVKAAAISYLGGGNRP